MRMLRNPTTETPLDDAIRRAFYGKKNQVAWHVDGAWRSSRLTVETLKQAIAEAEPKKIYIVHSGCKFGTRYSLAGLNIILRNLESGQI